MSSHVEQYGKSFNFMLLKIAPQNREQLLEFHFFWSPGVCGCFVFILQLSCQSDDHHVGNEIDWKIACEIGRQWWAWILKVLSFCHFRWEPLKSPFNSFSFFMFLTFGFYFLAKRIRRKFAKKYERYKKDVQNLSNNFHRFKRTSTSFPGTNCRTIEWVTT